LFDSSFLYIIDLIIHCFVEISSVSSVLPSGQLSNVPWRRADVKYTNNEAYFDIVEGKYILKKN